MNDIVHIFVSHFQVAGSYDSKSSVDLSWVWEHFFWVQMIFMSVEIELS